MSDSSWNTAEMPARLRGARIGGGERRRRRTRIVPRVGPDRAGEDLDEGALAGAVLAEQGVHLAGARRGTRHRVSATMPPKRFGHGRGLDQVHGRRARKETAPLATDKPPGRRREDRQLTSRPLLRR